MTSLRKRSKVSPSGRPGCASRREIEEWAGQLLSGWSEPRETDHLPWPAGSAPR